MNPTIVVHHPITNELDRTLRDAGYHKTSVASTHTVYQLDRATPPPADATLRPSPEVTPLAVSPRQAARYLHVGHDSIYQLIGSGRLRSLKLGRRRLIPMAELQRFLADEAV